MSDPESDSKLKSKKPEFISIPHFIKDVTRFSEIQWKTCPPNTDLDSSDFEESVILDDLKKGDPIIAHRTQTDEHSPIFLTGRFKEKSVDGIYHCQIDSDFDGPWDIICSSTLMPQNADAQWVLDYQSRIRKYCQTERKVHPSDQDLLKSPETTFGDVSLCIDEKDPGLLAHKSILSSRCEYFKRMLKSSFLESKSNRIILKVNDHSCISHELIHFILEYLYIRKLNLSMIKKWSWSEIKKAFQLFSIMELHDLTRFLCMYCIWIPNRSSFLFFFCNRYQISH